MYQSDSTIHFAEKILQFINEYSGKRDRKAQSQLLPAILPDPQQQLKRITRLDLERFGIANVKFSGSRESPYYTTTSYLTINDAGLPVRPLEFERKLQKNCRGGHILVLNLRDESFTSQDLVSFTRKLIQQYHIGFFTYTLQDIHG
jgi:anaerobic ribonucleoside-triphosphate reductase